MSTQAVTSGAARNNGGTVKKAGNTDTTNGPITVSRTLMQDAEPTPYGSRVVLSSGSTGSSGNVGTASALTNFAYQMVAGQYIMRRYTSVVNGSANTLLRSGASHFGGLRRSIPSLETTRALGSGYLTSWDYETGAITKGANAGRLTQYISPSGGPAVKSEDSAAHPTSAVPGELAYKTGAKLPVTDEYKPSTG